MGYLTPDTLPPDTMCRALVFPNNRQFLANVTGALEALTFTSSYTPFGTLTPEETASAMLDMFNIFSFDLGECRVIGEIIAFAGTTPPYATWLPCNGSSLPRADYADLFAVIGTTYGAIDSTHFNLPDMLDRTLVGAGDSYTVGQEFGEATHTLTTAEMPSHSHTDLGHIHSYVPAIANLTTIGVGVPEPTAIPGIGATSTGNANLTNTGGGGAHNNVQPSIGILYLIVAK